jgi:hypothetical protein
MWQVLTLGMRFPPPHSTRQALTNGGPLTDPEKTEIVELI